jgi:hypothetical protein
LACNSSFRIPKFLKETKALKKNRSSIQRIKTK